MLELILGGARSGKSRIAEERAIASGKQLFYIATAQAGDAEMAQRIQHHREQRDRRWTVIEEPCRLAEVLVATAAPKRCLLVDCLTLWMSNLLQHDRWPQERQALVDLLPQLPGDIILVSNEVGMGIIPMGELNRQFVDESGRLHQELTNLCHRVTFTVAGIPQLLKNSEDK